MSINFPFILSLTIVIVNLLIAQSKCPNWCNRRGICTNPSIDIDQYCICDVGYSGEDCSLKLCPKSYDFLDIPQPLQYRSVRLTTEVDSGVLSGVIELKFGLSAVYMNANSNDVDSNTCRSTFIGLKGIDDVECLRENYDQKTGTGSYLINILKYPIQPYENNIFYHNGNPSLSAFYCNTTTLDKDSASFPTCIFTDVNTENLPGMYNANFIYF